MWFCIVANTMLKRTLINCLCYLLSKEGLERVVCVWMCLCLCYEYYEQFFYTEMQIENGKHMWGTHVRGLADIAHPTQLHSMSKTRRFNSESFLDLILSKVNFIFQ